MSWALVSIAVVILAFAAVSKLLDGTPVTAAMFFTAAGLVLGAKAAGLVEPSASRLTFKPVSPRRVCSIRDHHRKRPAAGTRRGR